MSRPVVVFIVLAVAGIAAPVRAQSVAPLSLREALAEARRANPDIVALERQYESAVAAIPESRFLDAPMFETQIWGWPVTTVNPSRTDMYMFTGEQAFPGKGKRADRELVATREADVSQRAIGVRINQVLNQVKQAYADLLLARATADLYQEQTPLLETTADAATLRYASGHSGQHDTVRVVAEISRLQAEAVSWRERARLAEAALNTLLGRPAGAPVSQLLSLPGSAPAPADAERIALERNPELSMASAETAREEAELARLKGERRPDFVVGGGYMLQPGGAGAWTARGGLTWPNAPWSRGGFNTRIDAQEKRLAAARARQEAVASAVRRGVQEAIVRLDAARERARLLETAVLPQLDHTFEIARVAYAADRGDFADVLETQRLLLTTRMDVIAARADVVRASADLDLALGGVEENQ